MYREHGTSPFAWKVPPEKVFEDFENWFVRYRRNGNFIERNQLCFSHGIHLAVRCPLQKLLLSLAYFIVMQMMTIIN